jgi:hypothetical protein
MVVSVPPQNDPIRTLCAPPDLVRYQVTKRLNLRGYVREYFRTNVTIYVRMHVRLNVNPVEDRTYVRTHVA